MTADTTQTRRTSQKLDDFMLTWVQAWLLDCSVRNLSSGTIKFYRTKIKLFTDFCEGQVISGVGEVTPNVIRQFMLYQKEQGHNEGGIHAAYRTLKAFLRWYESEAEPDNWKNPIRKIRAPKIAEEPIEGVSIETIRKMASTCDRSFYGERDRAILLCLVDSGCRASEFLALDADDVDQVIGSVLIRSGKGRKPRTVYLGKQARKALRTYLKHREDTSSALWVSVEGERLHYDGLRSILSRRAAAAKVETPTPHDFRRTFALECLRNGVDLVTLKKLMGHSSLTVLQRYLKQITDDLQAAHRRGSPVDNSGLD